LRPHTGRQPQLGRPTRRLHLSSSRVVPVANSKWFLSQQFLPVPPGQSELMPSTYKALNKLPSEHKLATIHLNGL